MLRKLTLTIVVATGFTAISLFGQEAQAQGNTKGSATTLTGVISDSMCGAKHMATDKTAAECTRECVKQGSDYALVVGTKVYTLKGNASDFDKYAGERVTVKGAVSGDTIKAESVNPAKSTTKS